MRASDRLDLQRSLVASWTGPADRVLRVVAPAAARAALALPFLRSGLTRWDGPFSLSPATGFLFANVFKLHIAGRTYDLPAPTLLAWVTASAEIVLPALLILGLLTRWAALGILVMTCVIQLIFPDGWMNFHLYWAALALALMTLGGGTLSVDRLIARRVCSPAEAVPRTSPGP